RRAHRRPRDHRARLIGLGAVGWARAGRRLPTRTITHRGDSVGKASRSVGKASPCPPYRSSTIAKVGSGGATTLDAVAAASATSQANSTAPKAAFDLKTAR